MKSLELKKREVRLYVCVYIAAGSGEQARQVARYDWRGAEVALIRQGCPRPRWAAEEVEAC